MKSYQERINAYRIMWILVMYDLPMVTQKEKQEYVEFRQTMLSYGFRRFQFSMYIRHCSSRENADMHVDRVKKKPASGRAYRHYDHHRQTIRYDENFQ